MMISELVAELIEHWHEYGDIPVCSVNDNGPGGLCESDILTKEMVKHYDSNRYLDIESHLMIGET